MTVYLNVVTIDENNEVTAITEGDFEESPTAPNLIIVDSLDGIKLGDVYNSDGTFTSVTQYRTNLSRLEFRNKFTAAEKVSLYTAAETDINVKILLDDVAAAEYIELTDQEVSDAINYLASTGVINAARASEILAGVPIE